MFILGGKITVVAYLDIIASKDIIFKKVFGFSLALFSSSVHSVGTAHVFDVLVK